MEFTLRISMDNAAFEDIAVEAAVQAVDERYGRS